MKPQLLGLLLVLLIAAVIGQSVSIGSRGTARPTTSTRTSSASAPAAASASTQGLNKPGGRGKKTQTTNAITCVPCTSSWSPPSGWNEPTFDVIVVGGGGAGGNGSPDQPNLYVQWPGGGGGGAGGTVFATVDGAWGTSTAPASFSCMVGGPGQSSSFTQGTAINITATGGGNGQNAFLLDGGNGGQGGAGQVTGTDEAHVFWGVIPGQNGQAGSPVGVGITFGPPALPLVAPPYIAGDGGNGGSSGGGGFGGAGGTVTPSSSFLTATATNPQSGMAPGGGGGGGYGAFLAVDFTTLSVTTLLGATDGEPGAAGAIIVCY